MGIDSIWKGTQNTATIASGERNWKPQVKNGSDPNFSWSTFLKFCTICLHHLVKMESEKKKAHCLLCLPKTTALSPGCFLADERCGEEFVFMPWGVESLPPSPWHTSGFLWWLPTPKKEAPISPGSRSTNLIQPKPIGLGGKEETFPALPIHNPQGWINAPLLSKPASQSQHEPSPVKFRECKAQPVVNWVLMPARQGWCHHGQLSQLF